MWARLSRRHIIQTSKPVSAPENSEKFAPYQAHQANLSDSDIRYGVADPKLKESTKKSTTFDTA
jgi:hypothetical protein